MERDCREDTLLLSDDEVGREGEAAAEEAQRAVEAVDGRAVEQRDEWSVLRLVALPLSLSTIATMLFSLSLLGDQMRAESASPRWRAFSRMAATRPAISSFR